MITLPDKERIKKVFTRPHWFIAYGFGSGLSPWVPGTVGTAMGILLWIPLSWLPEWLYLVTVTGICFIGIHVSDRVSREMGESDPGAIVIDEIAGILITLFLIPQVWYWILAAFLLFRLLDIIKPWPIGLLDRQLKGGLGIMLDDLLAGFIALIIIQGGIAAGIGL